MFENGTVTEPLNFIYLGDDKVATGVPILPEELRKLREEYRDLESGKIGLTQPELAEFLGISLITIKKYESGEVIPSADIIVKMQELYDVILYFGIEKKMHPLLKKKREHTN
ncbi:MAG TPA: helix-turn-helix transcriptional regulator [Nitrososphaerales archaeon]